MSKSLAELVVQENDVDQLEAPSEVLRQDQQYDETIMHIKMMEALRKSGAPNWMPEIKSTSIGK